MLVYEVTTEIDPSIEADYRAWLGPHVAEIRALPGFTGARVHELVDPATGIGFCMQFLLDGEAALEAYLREHAPRLRADGVARFGDRMRATRRVMRLLDSV